MLHCYCVALQQGFSLHFSLTSSLRDFSQVLTQLHKSIRPIERELCHFIFELRLDQEALLLYVVVIRQIC